MSVNIKSLVEKLFHMSSSQAMPSTSEISVSASEGGGSFTAPSDGYLVLGARRKTSSEFAVVNIWNNINTCSASSDGYGQSRAYVPCKKGKTVQFSIIGKVDRSAFISTIGGGLNTILQSGGALCLRLTNSFKQLSSSLTHKLYQQRQQRKQQLLTEAGTQSFRLSTAMRCLQRRQETPATLKLLTTISASIQKLQIHNQALRSLCRLKKAETSTIGLQTRRVARLFKFDFSRLSAQANLAMGGAL